MKLCVVCKAIYTEVTEHCYVDGAQLQRGAIDGDPLLLGGLYAGRYKLTGRISSSRKGNVYHAWNEYLGQDTSYAIKILHTSILPETTDWWRFAREAHALSLCRHENVVEIFDAQMSPRASYLAMSFLHGQSLQQALRSGPFSLERALHCGLQLARGLSHIHSHTVIHRDLSPANIYLVAEGLRERVKIIDFGLARWPENPLTRSVPRLGERDYIAPELGQQQEANERSDQYSFGCVLYYMLCGRPPRGSGVASELVPPRAIRAHIPEEVETLVLRMLRVEPQERYRSMKEVIQVLEHLINRRLLRLVVLYDYSDRAAMESLAKALSPYRKEGVLTYWEPWMTAAGQCMAQQEEKEIQEADGIALLSSPDLWYSGSSGQRSTEHSLAFVEKRWLAERVRVIPILVRSARIPPPFQGLAALPRDCKPITHRRRPDEAWKEVAEELVQALLTPASAASAL